MKFESQFKVLILPKSNLIIDALQYLTRVPNPLIDSPERGRQIAIFVV